MTDVAGSTVAPINGTNVVVDGEYEISYLIIILWSTGGILLFSLLFMLFCILKANQKSRDSNGLGRRQNVFRITNDCGGSRMGDINPAFTSYDEIWTWIPVIRGTEGECSNPHQQEPTQIPSSGSYRQIPNDCTRTPLPPPYNVAINSPRYPPPPPQTSLPVAVTSNQSSTIMVSTSNNLPTSSHNHVSSTPSVSVPLSSLAQARRLFQSPYSTLNITQLQSNHATTPSQHRTHRLQSIMETPLSVQNNFHRNTPQLSTSNVTSQSRYPSNSTESRAMSQQLSPCQFSLASTTQRGVQTQSTMAPISTIRSDFTTNSQNCVVTRTAVNDNSCTRHPCNRTDFSCLNQGNENHTQNINRTLPVFSVCSQLSPINIDVADSSSGLAWGPQLSEGAITPAPDQAILSSICRNVTSTPISKEVISVTGNQGLLSLAPPPHTTNDDSLVPNEELCLQMLDRVIAESSTEMSESDREYFTRGSRKRNPIRVGRNVDVLFPEQTWRNGFDRPLDANFIGGSGESYDNQSNTVGIHVTKIEVSSSDNGNTGDLEETNVADKTWDVRDPWKNKNLVTNLPLGEETASQFDRVTCESTTNENRQQEAARDSGVWSPANVLQPSPSDSVGLNGLPRGPQASIRNFDYDPDAGMYSFTTDDGGRKVWCDIPPTLMDEEAPPPYAPLEQPPQQRQERRHSSNTRHCNAGPAPIMRLDYDCF